MARRIDWAPIKTEYITSDISYSKLAQKHGVCMSTLSDKARKEGWKKEKDAFQQKAVKKTVRKVASRTSSKAADQMVRLQESTGRLINVIEEMTSDPQQFRRWVVKNKCDKVEETEEVIFEKFDTKALKEATGAMRDLTAVLRDVYNLPTATEKSSMHIANERLKMDKRKEERENAEQSKQLEVILAEDLEDYST